MKMAYNFFAMIDRMKYIDRWALMRNSKNENISEHSHQVAVLAHALALIGNKEFGQDYDCARTALLALYHDATEVITGDMPTPVKYFNDEIRTAYKDIEKTAATRLLDMLPEAYRTDYETLLISQESDKALWKLVKAADKLSAYLKCVEEQKAGNLEFKTAQAQIYEALNQNPLPALRYFLEHFLPGFSLTLDELQK